MTAIFQAMFPLTHERRLFREWAERRLEATEFNRSMAAISADIKKQCEQLTALASAWRLAELSALGQAPQRAPRRIELDA